MPAESEPTFDGATSRFDENKLTGPFTDCSVENLKAFVDSASWMLRAPLKFGLNQEDRSEEATLESRSRGTDPCTQLPRRLGD